MAAKNIHRSTAVMASPYVPMLFMGEEYGETAPFFFFEDFADAILRVLDQPERWAGMGVSARRLAEARLNWRDLAAELETFLQRILAAG
ncbi:MAG: hypothetical protein HGA74_11380 [Deltaproteobacteria bacterium]|nr:hypothetical protein [Deltaproteobacteria bacterium]